MNPFGKKTAVICGGGPSGLAAAILLHAQGWKNILVIERRENHDTFERGKAFNYQLDGRGQEMLSYIGIDEAKIMNYGIANTKFVLNSFGPEGKEKSFAIPFVLPGKKTAYWITRSALLDMLYQRLREVNTDNRIKLLFGHRFEGLSEDGAVMAFGSDDIRREITADLVLGCDGVNSRLRKSLASRPDGESKGFEPVITPSPSSDLMYKVIRLPREISVSGKKAVINDHKKAYVFTSAYKEFHRRLSLFSLPVARPNEPRSANIILPSSHDFWKIRTSEELRRFLEDAFPQLDIDEIFPPDELEEYLELTPGKFPDPQYSPKILAHSSVKGRRTDYLLLGDAAHGFPPDLGLGVNSALEDVRLMGQELEASGGDILGALSRYETMRLPDSQALVRMVKRIFPYQYNQVPWRLKLSLMKFFIQVGISKLTFGYVDQPGFRLSQDHRPSFSELEKRIAKTDAIFYLCGLVGLAGLAVILFKIVA